MGHWGRQGSLDDPALEEGPFDSIDTAMSLALAALDSSTAQTALTVALEQGVHIVTPVGGRKELVKRFGYNCRSVASAYY